MDQPQHFSIAENEFDVSLLPKAGRERGSAAFRKHVTKYFRAQYQGLGGDTEVEFTGGNIVVTWTPDATDRNPMGAIVDLLNAGRYDQAAPMLETLLQANPRDHNALYNLGLVYSDQGRLDEARDLLRRAGAVAPRDANTWVSLGIAALRAEDREEARPALERAIELEPGNPFALRTLGTLHLMEGDHARGAERLREAVATAPNDPLALLLLAQALNGLDTDASVDEADGILRRLLQLAPHGEIAESAKKERKKIAARAFRRNAGGGLRPDALAYCLAALERFEGMDQGQLAPILMEMATLGQGGLPVNDPTARFTLRLLPGEAFSALQIVCMMHVGIKRIDPSQGSGFDIDREYEAALSMRGSQE